MGQRVGVVIIILLVVAIAAVLMRDRLTEVSGEQFAQVIYLLMALMLVGGGAAAGGRLGPGWFRNILIWACIGVALAVLYRAFGHQFAPNF